MNKRMKKKQAYKAYIKAIFEGYEKMLENPEIDSLTFTYLHEQTSLTRDEQKQIRFLTVDKA
ncbi:MULTISPECIES: hypothetical protein [Enterococcus]|uniref:Uncharacterized protein n=1 Tax=Enterococcus sulfureus ATCC 49903 TaxID=1140003 RepID=S0L836_9ENTE|nr:hypothetical protein [Enterococcus sulfureus]EOT47666.1 hypothetical protein OMY_01040 [Enterococcus sulfureus ATCC 49903]EOT83913.1 hypothetical protein I573_01638 [Enterococcus sulfureus ATCC 49903]